MSASREADVAVTQTTDATPQPTRIARYVLVGLALFVVGWLLWRSRSAMLPFVFSLVLAYMLMPMVGRLAHGMPRPFAIVLGYMNALSLLFFSIVFLAPRIVGDSVGIHPAILTVVLIAMGEALGFLGIVLSASIAAVARDLFSYTYQRSGGATPVTARANVRVFAKAPIE